MQNNMCVIEQTGFFRTRYNGSEFEYIIETTLVEKKLFGRTLYQLKSQVLNAGFLWGITDYNLATETVKIKNEHLFPLYGRYGVQHSTSPTLGLHLLKDNEVHIVNADPTHCLSTGDYDRNYRRKYLEYYDVNLPAYIQIHHIDRNRQNNSMENLVAVNKEEHVVFHKLLFQLNKYGFIQELSETSIHDFGDKLIYSCIIGLKWEYQTDYGWEQFTPPLEYLKGWNTSGRKQVYLPAEDWKTLNHICDVHKLYLDNTIPVVKHESNPLSK